MMLMTTAINIKPPEETQFVSF